MTRAHPSVTPLEITKAREITSDSPVFDPSRAAAASDARRISHTQHVRLHHVCDLAQELLDVGAIHLTIVDDSDQHYVAVSTEHLHAGEDHADSSPLEFSLCQHVVDTAAELAVPDLRKDPILCTNLAVVHWNIRAYLGEPIIDLQGRTLGSFCALDYRVRQWTTQDRFVLRHMATLAQAIMLVYELD